MTKIVRNLPNDQYEALLAANNPSSVNSVATLADVLGSGGNRVISGNAVYSGTGLLYNITALVYTIQGNLYNTLATTVTLNPGDLTNPRIDVIFADNLGVVGVIEGVPAPAPAKPSVDPLTQVEITFVTIAANATAPVIAIEQIYDENIAPPAEWVNSTDGPVIFNSAVDPYNGLVSIETTANFGPNKRISFQPSVPYTLAGGILTFWLNAKNPMNLPSSSFFIAFFDGGILQGNPVTLGGSVSLSFGFDPNITGAYQLVSIPISAFGGLPATLDELRIFRLGGGSTCQFFLDLIQIQEGVSTPQPPTAGHEILNSLTAFTQRPKLRFLGAGVTVSDNSLEGSTDVTIPGGGGGGSWQPKDTSLGDFVTSGAVAALSVGAGYYISFSATANNEILTNIGLAGGGFNYDGSALRIDIHNMLVGAGGVGATVLWEIDYAWVTTGENAYTKVDGTIANSVNVNGRASQILFTDALIIPAGTAGDLTLQLTLRRRSQGGGSDSFGGSVEIYAVDIIKI